MKNPYDGKNAGRNILITIALIAIGLFLWNTYISPLSVTYSSNWVRVTVSNPSGAKLSGVYVQIEKMNNVFIDKIVYTNSYGEADFKGPGTNGAWPDNARFDGVVHCGGEIKTFSGYTDPSTGNIVTRSVTCPCAGQYNCNSVTTTTLGNSPYCTDSDGGKDYNKKGTITYFDGYTQTKTDFCTGANKELSEYYCNGNSAAATTTICSQACVDGACITCSDSKLQVFDLNNNCVIDSYEVQLAYASLSAGTTTQACVSRIQALYLAASGNANYPSCTPGTTHGPTTTFNPTTTHGPTTTIPSTCEMAGYSSSNTGNCASVIVPILNRNCFNCGNCFNAWTYLPATDGAQGICINKQFCNYAGSPVTYATKELCDSANTKPSNLLPIIVLGGLIAVGLIYYVKKRR
jgi:hypothetical protein